MGMILAQSKSNLLVEKIVPLDDDSITVEQALSEVRKYDPNYRLYGARKITRAEKRYGEFGVEYRFEDADGFNSQSIQFSYKLINDNGK